MFDPDKSSEKFDEMFAEIIKLSTHMPQSKRFRLYDVLTEMRSEYMTLNSNFIIAEIKLKMKREK